MRRNTREKLTPKVVAKKIGCTVGTLIAVTICLIAVLISCSLKWMFNTWTNLTMDELVFHLTSPLEGTNEDMIVDYLNKCAVPVILMLLFLIIFLIAFRKEKKKYIALILAGVIGSVTIAAYFVQYTWSSLEVSAYVENQGEYSTFIDENYVDPGNVNITFPEQKKNLVYIFLESMEVTYADKENGGAFDKSPIPELETLAIANEDFSGTAKELNGGYSLPGTTWTAGAMFAQTSGLPLMPDAGNNMDTQNTFYGSASTLGDILQKAGYSQTLMIGSDAAFGGRELYFTEHGNFDILDYRYAVNQNWIPGDYRVWWGYEDVKLFSFAKEKLLELSQEGNPFNFTLLTADTHFEDGFMCEVCTEEFGDDHYANVMACSSRQVDEFVKWIQEQPFGKDTSIVIVGDHPTMDSDFCEDVPEDYGRKVYTCFVNGGEAEDTGAPREFTTFDIFPTTLASLGVTIEGDRLGLGTNLFSAQQTLTEQYGLDTETAELSKKSQLIEELAQFDPVKAEVRNREGFFPVADVFAGEYDPEVGVIPIAVSGLRNANNGIQTITVAVWTNDIQDDLQWIELVPQEDGSYIGAADVASFNYATGEYLMHAYLIDDYGAKYKLGETTKIINN